MQIVPKYASYYLKPTGLPLRIFMHEYTTRTIEWHSHHDFYELVVVCGGGAHNEFPSGGMDPVGPGNVLLMPPGSVHRYSAIRQFRHYNVLFSPELLATGTLDWRGLLEQSPLAEFTPQRRCSPLLWVKEQTLARLVLSFETVRQEINIQSTGWREAALSELIRTMIELIRNCRPLTAENSGNSYPIGRAVHLINENPAHNHTLNTLSKAVGMSESSFRHHFIETVGIAPIHYLIRQRLKTALLLMTSPNSLATIAMMSGFADQNYLARQFKRQFKITPHEFRKQYAAGALSAGELLTRLWSVDSLPTSAGEDHLV